MAIKEELKNEIATIQSDPAKFTFGGILTNEDETLMSRGGGKGLKIYDDIKKDPHAYAVLNKRANAVIAREWQVTPASESAIDKKAADLVREQLKNLKFDQTCKKLLDATLKGYSVGEIIWDTDGKEIVASKVKVKPQRRFVFDEQMQIRLLTRANPLFGEPLPERKFIVHRYGEDDDDSPYGLGLGHKLFWPVLFKRQDITFWLVFVDKFASPTAIGEYPQGTPKEEQKKLLDALSAISNESQVIIPEGMLVKFLEAARSGAVDTYEKLARYMDEQISECVLGETMSTTAKAAGLGSGQAEVHNEVRTELAKGDADLLSDTTNETLVRWMVELNLPNAKPPKVWRDFSEPEDGKRMAERDGILSRDAGVRFSAEYFRRAYGFEEGDIEAAGGEREGSGGEKTASFAEGERAGETFPDQKSVDDLIDSIEPAELQGQMEGTLKPVIDLINSAGDFNEIMEKLAEAYPDMDDKGLEDMLARAIFITETWGRLNA